MGEVYRADDLKLGQSVALKFLPPGLEGDPSRLKRFLDEVRTARQVTHSNVCRVYDIGEVDGQHSLSMEYVDGRGRAKITDFGLAALEDTIQGREIRPGSRSRSISCWSSRGTAR